MFVYVYLQVQCSSGNNRNISHMRNYLLLGLFKDSFSLETNGLGHLLPLVAKYKKMDESLWRLRPIKWCQIIVWIGDDGLWCHRPENPWQQLPFPSGLAHLILVWSVPRATNLARGCSSEMMVIWCAGTWGEIWLSGMAGIRLLRINIWELIFYWLLRPSLLHMCPDLTTTSYQQQTASASCFNHTSMLYLMLMGCTLTPLMYFFHFLELFWNSITWSFFWIIAQLLNLTAA